MNYQQWLLMAEQTLQQNQQHDPYLTPAVDANLLLQSVTQRSKAALFAFAETPLTNEQLTQLDRLLYRRQQGEPMAYILGEKEFWSLPLLVSPQTLIPRPDTELLVEQALVIALSALPKQSNYQILDLGTGTGAIALALAQELYPVAKKCGTNLTIFALDRVKEAVQLAKHNAKRLNLPIEVLQSHWFDQLSHTLVFDLIVSNPPYIDATDAHLHQGDVRFEPHSALISPQQGFQDLFEIIKSAPIYLKSEGWLLLEHGWQQGEKIRRYFSVNHWKKIKTCQDYAKNERITFAQR